MAQPKTVIVWGYEDLLAMAVEIFLNRLEGWDVIHISAEDNIDSFIQEVQKKEPSVVIIYRENQFDDVRLPMQLMSVCPQIKVITIGLENNFVEAYNKEKVWINNVSDLLSMVRV